MTTRQAEQWIQDYQKVLANNNKRGSRRDPTLLPAPKEQIVKAIKLQLAQLFLVNSHTNEDLTRPLINAAMFLDSFSELPIEAAEFIEAMHRRRHEIDSFCVNLLTLDRRDPFYWQRIYTMLGISSETRKTSFLEGMKHRFGIGSPAGLPQAEDSAGPRPVGRLTLD